MKRAAALLTLTTTALLATGTAAPADTLDHVGTATGVDERTAGLVLEVNELSRDSSGTYATLLWSVRNEGTERITINPKDTSLDFDRQSFAGVTLRDEESRTRFHPAMNSESACLCTRDTVGTIDTRLDPGATLTYWSLYSVPADLETVTVEVPDFGDVTDVPLT